MAKLAAATHLIDSTYGLWALDVITLALANICRQGGGGGGYGGLGMQAPSYCVLYTIQRVVNTRTVMQRSHVIIRCPV